MIQTLLNLKKIGIIGALTLLLSLSINAQDYYFLEDFNNLDVLQSVGQGIFTVPEGWVQYDLDMLPIFDGSAQGGFDFNELYPDPNVAFSVINFQGEDSPFVVSIAYYEGLAGPADDWLASPAIEIPGEGYTLSWKAKSVDASESVANDYEVVIATGNSVADLQGGDVVMSVQNESFDFVEYSVDLSAYAGQTIHIAIHENSDAGFLLAVDDIGITAPPAGVDAVLTDFNIPIEYAVMHRADVGPIGPFEGDVLNFSDAALENAMLNVYIDSIDADGNLQPVWSTTSEITPTVGILENASFVINETFTPTVEGFYALSYEVTHDAIDSDVIIENNFSEFYTFQVDETNYERDAWFLDVEDIELFYYPFDDLEAGEVEQTGAFGSVFEFKSFATIDSIGIFVYLPQGSITCDLFEFDPVTNTVGNLVATTETWEAFGEGGDNGHYQLLHFGEETVQVSPGYYIATANDPANGNLNMLYFNYYDTEDRLFIQDGAGSAWQSFSGVPSINVIATSSELASFVNYTYETSGLTIDFAGNANGYIEEWLWDFGNGNTATGSAVSETFEEGTYTVCLTGTWPDGMQLDPYCEDITVSCTVNAEVIPTSNTATIEITEGLEPFSILWTDANGNPFDEEGTTIEGLEEGVEYSVMVIDANGCSTTVTFSTVECSLAVGDPEINENNGNVNFGDSIESGQDAGDLTFYWEDAIGDDIGTGPVAFGLDAGDYTLVIEDEVGCTVEVSFTVPEPPVDTNIEELTFVNSLNVAPNPANEQVVLSIDFNQATTLSYSIYNIAGKLITTQDLGTVQQVKEVINVASFNNGVYFLQLQMDDQVYNQRLVIQK